MEFIVALIQSQNILIGETNKLKVRLQNGEEVTKEDVFLTELNLLVAYWTAPEQRSLIRPDSYKVAFSCATDAVVDSDFVMARVFIRTGAFLRLCMSEGIDQVVAILTEASHHNQTEGLKIMTECLHKTSTDRGCTIYLSKQNTCQCLRLHAAESKATPSMAVCAKCEKQKPKQELHKCGKCKLVSYCNVKCQVRFCRPLPSPPLKSLCLSGS